MNNLSKLFKKFLRSGRNIFTDSSMAENKNGQGTIPWTPLSKPIKGARFAVVSTTGAHLMSQEPFRRDDKGDPSYREIFSADLMPGNYVVESCIAKSPDDIDVGSLFPVEILNELASSGEIGYANYRHFSFFGHVFGSKLAELIHEHLPKVIKLLKSDEVDIVILTSKCKKCDHTMRIIQRAIETAGLVTISITSYNSGKSDISVPRSIYFVPVSDISGKKGYEKNAILKTLMDEVLQHLAVTSVAGLQSDIVVSSVHDKNDSEREYSKPNERSLDDIVYESFGHANIKTEEFAWSAYVKFY